MSFGPAARAWVFAGWGTGELSLVATHGVFLAIKMLGIWQWLG